jgi:divIVA domain protein
MKGKLMLITPQEVRDAQISTRFFGTGYDIEETDRLLDNCARTIEVVGAHCVELQSALLTMKRLLEAHNIPIPQTI